jgi:catechol 2,3-dioxygenase-like lactoylglutathione lyase family enzyme
MVLFTHEVWIRAARGGGGPLARGRAARDYQRMKTIGLLLTLVTGSLLAQSPAYHDSGMKAVTQVAIICRDIDATSKRWAAVLGVDPPAISTTKPGHEVKAMFRGHATEGRAKLAFIKLGQVTLELIQPVGGDTSWQQFLDKNGEGVQHIAFQVTDLNKSVDAFGDAGMPVLHQGRYDNDRGSYVYIDSASALGVTLELLHSDPQK